MDIDEIERLCLSDGPLPSMLLTSGTILDLIAALRVAQEATRTARKDADRLANALSVVADITVEDRPVGFVQCDVHRLLVDHAAAVAARTTNGEAGKS